MTPFQCIAIPTETAERFRRTGTDDNEPIEVQVPGRGGRAPPFDDTGL